MVWVWLACNFVLGIPAVPQVVPADVAWVAEQGFCEPETVLALPDDKLLVSNVCDFRSRGDGYLSLLNSDGEVLRARHVEGLDSPLGMAWRDGRVYVVDANQVRVFDWPVLSPAEVIRLPTRVANDIAVASDGTLYVTDSATHGVYRRSPDGTGDWMSSSGDFRFANGLHLQHDVLWVGGERLWRVSLADESVRTIGPPWLRDIDGIELEADGTLQVAIVGGPFLQLEDDGEIVLRADPRISSTNHAYLAGRRLAVIPTGYDNLIVAIRLPKR